MSKSLTEAQYKKVSEAHAKGEPLPEGVTFAPYNDPPYVATEEYFEKHRELSGGPEGSGTVVPVEGSSPTS